MKKSFKIGEKGKAGKATYQVSPLDLILGDDQPTKVEKEEKKAPKSQKQISEERPIKTVSKPKKETSPSSKAKSKQVVTPVDKRRVEDKKLPFSTVLRGNLQKELKEVLQKYRQEVDFEYNKAQFMEDAVKRQITFLSKKLSNSS